MLRINQELDISMDDWQYMTVTSYTGGSTWFYSQLTLQTFVCCCMTPVQIDTELRKGNKVTVQQYSTERGEK